MEKAVSYTEKDIERLPGLEHIRRRPGMYISDSGSYGLHHCIREAIDNVVDEMEAGFCNELILTLHKDGSCSVEDDGRGIPVGNIDDNGKQRPAIELAVGELLSGGKFNNNSYSTSAGLHGVGIKATNATSEWFNVIVQREGKIWEIGYQKGKLTKKLNEIGETKKTGTKVHFKPDPEIFQIIKYNSKVIRERLEDLSFLLPNKKFILIDEEKNTNEVFNTSAGLRGLLLNKIGKKQILHEPILVEKEKSKDKLGIFCSFVYTNADDDINIVSFVNNVHTGYDGTHVEGFQNAIWDVLKNDIINNPSLKSVSEQPKKCDALDGIVCVLSVKIVNPEFQGQTKNKLGNPEVKELVLDIVKEKFEIFLQKNPKVKNEIIEKSVATVLAREAAKQAKAHVRRKKVGNTVLPGKLTDCSIKEMEGTEIFIVEGDSAAGTAKDARDSSFQAILPLRGKILNAEKKTLVTDMLQNKEIEALMNAIGIHITYEGEGKEKQYKFELDLRYEKIIILTDADVDGSHIATLLITFFYKFVPDLIKNGHLFLAVSPLYRVIYNKIDKYIINDAELKKFMREKDENKVTIFRFKGLGEMDAENLRDTVMDKEKRQLIKLTINDLEYAEDIIGTLMGVEVAPRRNFIETHALEANIDI